MFHYRKVFSVYPPPLWFPSHPPVMPPWEMKPPRVWHTDNLLEPSHRCINIHIGAVLHSESETLQPLLFLPLNVIFRFRNWSDRKALRDSWKCTLNQLWCYNHRPSGYSRSARSESSSTLSIYRPVNFLFQDWHALFQINGRFAL